MGILKKFLFEGVPRLRRESQIYGILGGGSRIREEEWIVMNMM